MAELLKIDGKFYAEVDTIKQSERKDILCPDCEGEPHGTYEHTTTVAYANFCQVDSGFQHTGTTESDDVWDNQETLTFEGKTVLECSDCFAHYVTGVLK